MKRKLLLIPAVTLTLVTGCDNHHITYNKKEQTEISLSGWGNDVRNEYTLEAIDKFEELHQIGRAHV